MGGAGAGSFGHEFDWGEIDYDYLIEAEGGVFGKGVVGQVHYCFYGVSLDFVGFGGGGAQLRDVRKSCESFEVVEGDPCRGGSLALAMRSLVLVKLLKAFSQEASFPPSGPMMNPRYSAAAQMLNEAHLGQCLVR